MMSSRLIASIIGTSLTFGAVGQTFIQSPSQQTQQPQNEVRSGNLTISTVPGNAWIRVNDYIYTERIPPALDLSGWQQGFPVQAVVRDSRNQCIGRITNESGQLTFIFVEADPPMCNGATPGAAQSVAEAQG